MPLCHGSGFFVPQFQPRVAREHALVRSETTIELLTMSFLVVHVQTSDDEFESTMDGEGGMTEERI